LALVLAVLFGSVRSEYRSGDGRPSTRWSVGVPQPWFEQWLDNPDSGRRAGTELNIATSSFACGIAALLLGWLSVRLLRVESDARRLAQLSLDHVRPGGAGSQRSLALKADGTVRAWGYDSSGYGTLSLPGGMNNVVRIAAGSRHALALRSDGSVVGWGDNSLRQLSWPPSSPPLANVIDLASAVFDNVAVASDGTVASWGYSGSGVQAGLSNVVSVAAGKSHNAALTIDGRVAVWGGNAYGQQNAPSGLADAVALASGDNHVLALAAGPVLVPGGLNPALGGAFTLTWEGVASASYSVWDSSNLVHWTQLGTATEPTPGRFSFSDTDAPKSSRRFYQVRSP
jgi:hypothetical protein